MPRDYDSSVSAVLEGIKTSSGLDGLAVVDLATAAANDGVLYSVGDPQPGLIATGRLLLTGQPGRPTHLVAADRRPLLACPAALAPGRPGGLLMWRRSDAASWSRSDYGLANAIAFLLQVVLDATLGQPGLDRLTGVPNLRWFLEEPTGVPSAWTMMAMLPPWR